VEDVLAEEAKAGFAEVVGTNKDGDLIHATLRSLCACAAAILKR